ncbi:S-adenosyl-L-methionine-dependent methyltransferase [Amanita muscaria]
MSDMKDSSGWNASQYNQTASFVYSSEFTGPVLSLLDARPGERIIDFGCGSGEVTLEIEQTVKSEGRGLVVGVDHSASMISKAKENGLEHAFVADMQNSEELDGVMSGVREKFDAVFTNAALHWCKRDPAGVLLNAKRVLKPGGRIAGEMGGFMNCIGVRSALHRVLKERGYDPDALDPWYFPSMEDYVKLLVNASFEPTHLSLSPRVTPLKAGLYEWLNLFARPFFLKDVPGKEAEAILHEVVDMCRRDCQDESGKWAMVYMRLRFCATLKD